MSKEFDIPVVIIFFRRAEKTVKILEKISQVQPRKIYLISDEGRSDAERCEVAKTREAVEAAITWNCVVVKDYATENKGVYDRIGLGALRVFEKEKWAIFLEDDNLPEVSFFYYCRELLEKYEHDQRVLWICGTNYLEKCSFESGADYGFTRHMLPCGWASWSEKFSKYYDKNFGAYNQESKRAIRSSYSSGRLYKQDVRNWDMEISNYRKKGKYLSWDYHMGFSLRVHGLYGVFPRNNQIRNIGVDAVSEHGGTTFDNVMTQRLCGMDSAALNSPLIHPDVVECDNRIERELSRIITVPISIRSIQLLPIRIAVAVARYILRVPEGMRLRERLTIQRGRKASNE